MLEVENSSPVVRFVFNESAGCAGRYSRKVIVEIHGDIETTRGEAVSFRYLNSKCR